MDAGLLDTIQKQNLIDNAVALCDKSSVVYNMTLTFKRKFDDIESYDMLKYLEPIFKIGLSSKKMDIQWFVRGAYEPFVNTPTRCHIHCQLYIYSDLSLDVNKIQMSDVIDKLHGILNKKIGNTKIVKNLSRSKFDFHKRQLGLDIVETQYPEYCHYMYKQVKHKRDLFKIN